MANEQNLKPPFDSNQDHDTCVKNGRKGGIKSGEARRRKRTMKQCASMLLSMPITSKELKQKFRQLGIEEDEATYQMGVMVAMMQSAMKGSTRAASFIRDTMGENPMDQLRAKELKLAREQFEYMKERDRKADGGVQDEVLDDGFVAALNGSAQSDWGDYDTDPEADSEWSGGGEDASSTE